MTVGMGNVPRSTEALATSIKAAAESATEQDNVAMESLESFTLENQDEAGAVAAQLKKASQPLDEKKIKASKKGEEGKNAKPAQLLPLKEIGEKAQGFQQRNPALKEGHLVLLSMNIKEESKAQDILDTVTRFYPDVTLADEAFQFLLEITSGELNEQVKEAIKQFKELKGAEVEAGKNVAEQAMEATEKGLGNYNSLTDLYNDITGNVRDSTTLFDQLSKKYDYKELKAVMDYLLHTLGANMKAKGTNIPRAELVRLVNATRSLQAITGVYRFFNKRMDLVEKLFKEQGIPVPEKLSFESMAKSFMTLVAERYPSSEKVKQQASRLGVENTVPGKIIAFNQRRDGIREVALNQIYRSVNHRDELYGAILEALEEFEEASEALEEVLETKTSNSPAMKDSVKVAP